MERGFSIDIAKAEATQEEDRRRILNSVAGKEEAELDTEPPTEHEEFTQVHKSGKKTPLSLMFQKQIELYLLLNQGDISVIVNVIYHFYTQDLTLHFVSK